MRIIVHGTNWIGDAVMTLPALKLLRTALPHAHIALYSRKWAEGIFKTVDSINEIVVAPSEDGVRSQAAIWRKGNFDASLLFTNSFRTALIARTARVPMRFGYSGEGRGFLLTNRVKKPIWKGSKHETEYYGYLVEKFCKNVDVNVHPYELEEPEIPIGRVSRDASQELLDSNGHTSGRPLIGFGAGSQNSEAKRWPVESFQELAKLLVNQFNATICLLGSPAEAGVASAISKSFDTNVVNLVGITELEEIPALLSSLDCFVSNDMGLAHLSRAVGTRTLTIFGPTNPKTTAPIGGEIIYRPEVECAPCMLRECPIDHRCMTRIEPKEIAAQVLSLIKA